MSTIIILGAMKLKIREIVLIEQRPVCYLDLRKFEINGQTYEMDHGTFRNNISKLRKTGEIEEAFRSKPMFYTIPGKKFSKSMTYDHMGVLNTVINEPLLQQSPIYKWLKNHEYALREENRILFNKMLSECGENKDYVRATSSKGESYSAESFFLALIFQQQKMISQLIAKLSEYKWNIYDCHFVFAAPLTLLVEWH